MARVQVRMQINARPEVCFDLARSQSAHVHSAIDTSERILEGPSHDLLEVGDRVTFEGRHLGFRRRFTTEVIKVDAPHSFVDVMRKGAFRSFRHEHIFRPSTRGTEMIDKVDFVAPYGPLGRLAERLVLSGYLRRFLVRRARILRTMAEQVVDEA